MENIDENTTLKSKWELEREAEQKQQALDHAKLESALLLLEYSRKHNDEIHWACDFHHETKPRLWGNVRNKTHYEFSIYWPHEANPRDFIDYKFSNPHINIAKTKSIQQIAKDIERRLLTSEMLDYWNKSKEYEAKKKNTQNRYLEVLTQLNELDDYKNKGNWDLKREYSFKIEDVRLSIRPYNPECLTIKEFDIDLVDLPKVIAFMKTLRKETE